MPSEQTTAQGKVTQGLLPCPFCGFDSQCLTTVTAGAGMFDALQCQNCGATGPYNTNEVVHGDGPTRWNTRHREAAERRPWRPIETAPLWVVAIVTDGKNVAISQKAEDDDGGHYWAVDPEDGLDWTPTHWVPDLDGDHIQENSNVE